MYQGRLNKARRGELFGPPPIGYIAAPSGEPTIDPDEQVQAVVRLLFDQFDRQGTVHGLLRYLVHHRIQIPVRPNHGPNRGRLEWHRPSRGTLLNLLHHPIYAGAYRHGYRPTDPRRQQPGRPGTGRRVRCAEECLVLIRDKLPAYISWDHFQANQQRWRTTEHAMTRRAPRVRERPCWVDCCSVSGVAGGWRSTMRARRPQAGTAVAVASRLCRTPVSKSVEAGAG